MIPVTTLTRARPILPIMSLPTRKRLRLSGHHYSGGAAYHLTLCTWHRRPLLARFEGDRLVLTQTGDIAREHMDGLPARWPGVSIVCDVIMPDHLHLVLELTDTAEVTIPRLMCRFKGLTARAARDANLIARRDLLWQRGYHDRVVRGPVHMNRLRRYIANNPMAWVIDHGIRKP